MSSSLALTGCSWAWTTTEKAAVHRSRIKAIVFLRESESLRIEPAVASAALPDLWHLNFRLATQEDRARSFQQLAQLAGAVTSWNVYRPLRLSSLDPTVELIAKHFDS